MSIIRWRSAPGEMVFAAASPKAFVRVLPGTAVYYDPESATVGVTGAASLPFAGHFVRCDAMGRVVVAVGGAEGVVGANGRAVLDVPVNQGELDAAKGGG